jgi:hypothetical protein
MVGRTTFELIRSGDRDFTPGGEPHERCIEWVLPLVVTVGRLT